MSKLISAVVLVATVAALSVVSRAEAPPERPPGVAVRDWVQLGERMGFVTVHERPKGPGGPDPAALYLAAPTPGYFMMKGPTGWTRVIIVEPVKGPGATG